MKKLIILTLALASIGCFAQAVPYDIKGDRLGMSLDDFKKKYYSFHPGYPKQHIPDGIGPTCAQQEDAQLMLSAEEAAAGVVACYSGKSLVGEIMLHRDAPPTIANVPLAGYAHHFYKGHLFRVIALFPCDGYDTMKAAFAEKFGAPAITPHELQNSYGAKFDGEESNWSNGVSAIQMKRRVTDLSTGAMVMTLPEIEKQVEAATPKKPKDL